MNRLALILTLCAVTVLLSGCSTLTWICGCATDLVVVLPSSDGHIGGVVVESSGSKIVLDQPYAEAAVESNRLKPHMSDAGKVQRIFSEVLAARPVPPKEYVLYFVNDSDELVPESRPVLETIFTEISSRKAAEVVITGHTDTVGGLEYNDRLSLTRANSVEKLFAGHGIAEDAITAVGRGKRELLVATPDETPEPRNRRVVITVR